MRIAVLLALLAAASPSGASAASPAPAVHDAYAPALAEARTRGVPLLVDVWAPW